MYVQSTVLEILVVEPQSGGFARDTAVFKRVYIHLYEIM